MKREMDDVHRTKTVGKAASAGRVVPLSQLTDYQVAEGDPDVRGWEVVAADGARLGTVDDLLVDTAQMKVRYLDVELEQGVAASDVGHGYGDRGAADPLRQRAEGDRALGREGTYATTTPPGLLGAVGAAGGTGTPGTAGAGPVIGDRLSGEERLADASARSVADPVAAEPGNERLSGEQRLADASAGAASGATTDVAEVASHVGTRDWAGGHDDRGEGSRRGRHVLIPIGAARLDEDADRVLVQGHGREHLHGLPGYGHGDLSREDESALRQRFDSGYRPAAHAAEAGDADFYGHDLYDEDRFYGARRGAVLPTTRGRS